MRLAGAIFGLLLLALSRFGRDLFPTPNAGARPILSRRSLALIRVQAMLAKAETN